jgi:hypothetical protein
MKFVTLLTTSPAESGHPGLPPPAPSARGVSTPSTVYSSAGLPTLFHVGATSGFKEQNTNSGVAQSAGKPADLDPKADVSRCVRMCSTEVSRGCIACRWLGELDPSRPPQPGVRHSPHLFRRTGREEGATPCGMRSSWANENSAPTARAVTCICVRCCPTPEGIKPVSTTSYGDQTCVWSAEQNVLRHRMPNRRPKSLRSPIHHHVNAFGPLDSARERRRSNPTECCHPAAARVPPGSSLVHPPRKTTIRNVHHADR